MTTIDKIKRIVAVMGEYFDENPDMKDYIYRTGISLEDYRRELVSSVLEGDIETSKTYEDLSERELDKLDELVEVLVENAGTWNNPDCMYDYMSFNNVDELDYTGGVICDGGQVFLHAGLYDILYDAVTSYWTEDN